MSQVWHVDAQGIARKCQADPSNPRSTGCPYGASDHIQSDDPLEVQRYTESVNERRAREGGYDNPTMTKDLVLQQTYTRGDNLIQASRLLDDAGLQALQQNSGIMAQAALDDDADTLDDTLDWVAIDLQNAARGRTLHRGEEFKKLLEADATTAKPAVLPKPSERFADYKKAAQRAYAATRFLDDRGLDIGNNHGIMIYHGARNHSDATLKMGVEDMIREIESEPTNFFDPQVEQQYRKTIAEAKHLIEKE